MAEKDGKNRGAPRRDGKPRFSGPKTPRGQGRDDKGGDRKAGGERPAKFWGDKRPEGGFKPRGPKPEYKQHRDKHPNSARERSSKDGPRPAARPHFSRPADDADQTSERIARRLARAGIASRRDAEALIADGRVRVNGVVLTSPAFNVSASDRIELDGVEIPPIERTRLFLFHKPAGVVTTNRDPEGRRTVFDVLPKDLPRLITVGRLDINTEGLLLLTNDGGLARLLELPATGWLRRYRARVHGKVDEKALADLRNGIAVDGVFYGSVEASFDREQGSNAWLTIGLREGKNREVKNILGTLGLEVARLIRVSYGPFQLGELAEGAVQELKGRMLRDQLGERLIEEAGANFEAPVVNPFSNKPVHGKDEALPERADRPKIVRDGIQGRIGEGGLIKQRRRDRTDERDAALSRLTTRPDAGRSSGKRDKPFAGRKEKPGERAEPTRARTSNVWMAPGARPQGRKHEAAASASPRRGPGEPAQRTRPGKEGQRSGYKPGGKPEYRGKSGPGKSEGQRGDRRPGGKPGPGKGRGGADRRR
jgi:23S rRNA pseudouridine2605 synthase